MFGAFDLDFWWELALLIVIMLLGHWLEMRALGQASSALDALAALLPDEADLVTPRDPGQCRSASWAWVTWSWAARAAGCRPTG